MEQIVSALIVLVVFAAPVAGLGLAGLLLGWFRLGENVCRAPVWRGYGWRLSSLLCLVLGAYLLSAIVGGVAAGLTKDRSAHEAVLAESDSTTLPATTQPPRPSTASGPSTTVAPSTTSAPSTQTTQPSLDDGTLIRVNVAAQVGCFLAEVLFGWVLLRPYLRVFWTGAVRRLAASTGLPASPALAPSVSPPLPGQGASFFGGGGGDDTITRFPLAGSAPQLATHSATAHPAPVTPSIAASGDLALPNVVPAPLSPGTWPWGLMALALPAAWLAGILTGLIQQWIDPTAKPAHEFIRILREDPSMLRWVALSAVIFAPLTEEFLFRGLLQSWFRGRLGKAGRWGAVLLASALFMAVHPMFSWPAIFLLGAILGLIYERSGSLVPCILVHASFNLVSVVFAVLLGT